MGIDAVDSGRMAELLGAHPERFLDRCFRDGDIARERSLAGRIDPARVAIGWAAKEALLKALGGRLRHLPYRDVECVRADSGRLELRLHGDVAARAREGGVARCRLDVTAAGEATVAWVLLESAN